MGSQINFLVLMLYISVFVVLIIVALDGFGIQIGFIEPIKRLSESVTQIFIGSVNSDSSILGRQASIEAGMKILDGCPIFPAHQAWRPMPGSADSPSFDSP